MFFGGSSSSNVLIKRHEAYAGGSKDVFRSPERYEGAGNELAKIPAITHRKIDWRRKTNFPHADAATQ